MNVFCLGGAGMICREAVQDLVKYSSCQKITIADYDMEAGLEVTNRLNDPRVDFVRIDVRDKKETIKAMEGYDVVMDGTTIGLNGLSTECIARYLMQSEEGKTTELYGYALHVEVEGEKAGKHLTMTYTHSHPASDGSVPEWEGLRSYT